MTTDDDILQRLAGYEAQNAERDAIEAEVRDRAIAAMDAFQAQVLPLLLPLRGTNTVRVAVQQVLTSMSVARMQLAPPPMLAQGYGPGQPGGPVGQA